MILIDREIESALKFGQLSIEPRPNLDAITSTAIDLTLARNFTTWDASPGVPLRPGAKGHSYSHLAKFQKQEIVDSFELKPQSFVLA